MKTAIALAACLFVAGASAVETKHGTIVTLTDDEAEQCEAGGGCVFVTREKLIEAVEKLAKRVAGDCRGSI